MCSEAGSQPAVNQAAVIGAGVMGTGIAQVLASAGIEVTLVDKDGAALQKASQMLGARLGRIASAGPIRASSRIEDVGDAEAVVEAVYESLDVKREVFSALDGITKAEALLATNTSSLSVSAIASVTSHPERVLGFHFMNPAPVMKLVEVVRAPTTSERTVERAAAFARQVGKTPVVVADRAGFVVNRLLMPLINEAARALEDGVATAEAIDAAMKLGANFPMGPLHLADLIGIDVVVRELRELERHIDARHAPSRELLRRAEAGRLGRKTGYGFFEYSRPSGGG